MREIFHVVGDVNREPDSIRRIREIVRVESGVQPTVCYYHSGEAIDEIVKSPRAERIVLLDASLAETERSALAGAVASMKGSVLDLGCDPLPIDLSGSGLSSFEHLPATGTDAEVASHMSDLLAKLEPPESSFRVFDGFDSDEPSYVVCAEIPDHLRPAYGQDSHHDYLRLATFADVDALVQVQLAFAAASGRRGRSLRRRGRCTLRACSMRVTIRAAKARSPIVRLSGPAQAC